MNPTILGFVGPGFLIQVPTLVRVWGFVQGLGFGGLEFRVP